MAEKMLDVALGRIVIQDGADRQYIFLSECNGKRGFPIVIGNHEAGEIQRVVVGVQPERPLTHQLCFDLVRALGTRLRRVDIVDLRDNTFFAQVVLENKQGRKAAVVDARPSDAIALAMRARCPIRVAERVLRLACGEDDGTATEEP
jgi:hypothetical protein